MERPPSEDHPPLFDEQTSGTAGTPGPGADKSEALRRIRRQLRVQDERVEEAVGQEAEAEEVGDREEGERDADGG